MYGMPYAPPPPKSGCRFVWFGDEMFAISVAESPRTAVASILVFQGLLSGNTEQPPTCGAVRVPPPSGGVGTQALVSAATATSATAKTRPSMDITSASRRAFLDRPVVV